VETGCLRWAAEKEERQDQIRAQRAAEAVRRSLASQRYAEDAEHLEVRAAEAVRLGKKRAAEAVRLGKKRADEDDGTWLAIPMFPSFNPDVSSFLEDAVWRRKVPVWRRSLATRFGVPSTPDLS